NAVQDRCLSDSDLPGDDDKTVFIGQRKTDIRNGPLVLFAHIQEIRVWEDLERPARQAKVISVHAWFCFLSALWRVNGDQELRQPLSCRRPSPKNRERGRPWGARCRASRY